MTLITRKEALEELGTTERQLQRHAAQGKVSVRYIPSASGKKEARYDRAEIQALRAELNRTAHRPTVEGDKTPDTSPDMSPMRYPGVSPTLQLAPEFIDQLRGVFPFPAELPPSELKQKPILTLREAASLSGLSYARLRDAVRSGDLVGSRIGQGIMVDTEALIAFARHLVRGAEKKSAGNG